MGTRSDVFIAVKRGSKTMPADVATFLQSLDPVHEVVDEGECFFIVDVRWGLDHPCVDALYAYLGSLPTDSYLVIEACYDYPASDDGDIGQWHDNPWGARKSLSVAVAWDPQT